MLRTVLLATLFITPATASGRAGITDNLTGRSWFALPVAVYTSDTGFGFGGVFLTSYHQDRPRLSLVQGTALYTLENQFTTNAMWDHFSKDGNRRLHLKGRYSVFPGDYFGLGNDTANDDPERYTPEETDIEAWIEYRAAGNMLVRGGMLLYNHVLVESDPGGLGTGAAPIDRGRFDVGIVAALVRDTRDNYTATTGGSMAKLEFRGYPVQNEGGSFDQVSLDIRTFREHRWNVVGAAMLTAIRTSGNVPYYLMPSLGAEERLRGYERNRFRDRCAVLAQYDIRFPIAGPFGGAVFAAAGRVGPSLADAFGEPWHAAAGVGLRFYFNREEHLMVRLDYARGADSSGVYATFGEAF